MGSYYPQAALVIPATTPVWRSRAVWLRDLAALLERERGRAVCHSVRTRPETVMVVARLDASSADHSTGRNVRTAHETVARTMGCSAKTVQRARKVLELLGVAITVERGRYLTAGERAAAFLSHGWRQSRMASNRALITPRPDSCEQGRVHLPPSGFLPPSSPLGLYLPTRASAPAASRAAARTSRKHNRSRAPRASIPLGSQRLAARVGADLGWIDAQGRVRVGCEGLTRGLASIMASLGMDESGWTARDVGELIEKRNKEFGYLQPTTGQMRNPLGLLTRQLRTGLALFGSQGPRTLRERARATEQERQAAEAAARRADTERARADRARNPGRGREVIAQFSKILADARERERAEQAARNEGAQ